MRDIAIQFSGGKDSLAALHLSRPLWDRMTVYYADTGGFYQHMVDFVHKTCSDLGLSLKVISPPFSLEDYHAAMGLPSDIVPVERSPEMRAYNKTTGVVLQSPLQCCAMMQWMGLDKAIVDDGIKRVIRGSKAADQHVGAGDGAVDWRGITYHCPVWTWTDDDVFAYLRENNIVMAEHYSEVNNSFDCILCTAFLRSDGAKARIEYTKKHYPKEWPELKRRMLVVRGVVDSEREAVNEVLSLADDT